MIKGKKFTQLQESERTKIEVLLQQGMSISAIARALERSVSTISREIKRNGPKLYRASRAHYFTGLRHRNKPKRIVFDQSMRSFIDLQLQSKRWSPELISVEGKKWNADFISTEWIYRWIWAMKFSMRKADKRYQQLYTFLKHGSGRKRRGKNEPHEAISLIENGLNIVPGLPTTGKDTVIWKQTLSSEKIVSLVYW